VGTTGATGVAGITGATGTTGATGATGPVKVVLDWGTHNKNVSTANNCMSMHNVDQPSPCEVLFTAFMNDSTSTSFGPTPSGGITISGLFARALSPGLTNTYTVDVISTNSSSVTTVLLSCQVNSTITGNTCSDASSASVPGDVYLQVRVTADSKAAPNTTWRAIFLY